MTPDQRLGVWAARSAANAGEIIHWIGDHSPALQVCAQGLAEDASVLASKAAKLAAAALEPPCIAVLGSATRCGRSVVHALTSPQDMAIMAGFDGLTQRFDVGRHILPDGQTPAATGRQDRAANARSAIVRYSSARDPGRSIPGYPVRVALLAATGVIKILTGIYQASPAAHAPDPDFAFDLQAALAAARGMVNASATSSLTAEDIRDIRAHLTATHPHAPNLDRLSAAGYWETLAGLGPYLPDAALRQLLAMLWGRDEGLTSVFALYDAALSSLGYARDILCPIEALAERDPVSGWFRPHPLSILRSSTISHAIDDEAARVHVARRHGQVTEISRAVIAALAAHVVIQVRGRDDPRDYEASGFGLGYNGVQPASRGPAGGAGPARQAPAPDILDFPALALDGVAALERPRLVSGVSRNAEARGGSDRDHDRREAALVAHLQRFAAAKPAYLFRRAVEYHTVTGLIVCVAPGEPADDAMAAAIGTWVDQVQGATPSARARQKSVLLLAGPAQSDGVNTGTLAGSQVGLAAQADCARSALAHLSQMVHAHDSWFKEWSPGRAFQNAVLIPAVPPPLETAGHRVSHAQPAARHAGAAYPAPYLATAYMAGHGPFAAGAQTAAAMRTTSLPSALDASPAHVAGLLGPFLTAITPAVKTRQLSQQLTTVRRQLRARLLRFDPSQEPEQVNAWRTETNNTMQAGLLRVVDAGRFGQLLAALVPSDEAIEHLIETRHDLYLARTGAAQDCGPGLPVGARWTPDPSMASAYAADMADAVLAFWLTSMRRTASAGRLAQDTGFPQALLDHLIDEIGLGVLRTGLGAHLTHALQPAAGSESGSKASLRRVAAVASRTIARFLEDLRITDSPLFHAAGQSRAAGTRATGANGLKHTPSRAGDGILPVTGTEFAIQWCVALDTLIDENIAAGPLLRTLIGSDRQLGELLAELSSSPTEVET